jgi:hypothetical protein
MVTSSPTIDDAYQGLLGEFEVEAEHLHTNLTELVGRLVDNGLLQVFPSDVGTPAAV